MVYPNPQIYDHLRAIFVHVPKCAGTSIENALKESQDRVVGGHTTALGYLRAFPEKFRDYFKFAIVRHPADRLVSAFNYTSLHEDFGFGCYVVACRFDVSTIDI